MKKENILSIVQQWKENNGKKLYTPFKYFDGLTTKQSIIKKLEEMDLAKTTRSKQVEYKTDSLVKNNKKKRSPYHTLFEKQYGIASPATSSSLSEIAKVSGVPLTILEKVRDRGYAAWSSGHRPGASRTQWANARVSSFLTRGCTCFSGDFDLMKTLLTKKKKSEKQLKFLKGEFNCPKSKLISFQKKNGSLTEFLNREMTAFIF